MRLLNFLRETFADALSILRSPEGLKSLYGVSLYRNAIYLMLTSGITAVLGFAFWVVVARLYLTSDVGLGSALISAAGLLSFIGTLGLGFAIIRYLPGSENKAWLLNSSFTFAGIAAMLVALVFLAGLPLWSPKLIFVRQNPIFLAAFVVFVAAATLSSIVSQAFVAFRRAGFTLAQGLIFSLLKLILAAGFASAFKVFGIFASWGIAAAVGLGLSLLAFLPWLLPGYRPLPCLRLHLSPTSSLQPPNPGPQTLTPGELVHFSFANYVSDMLWSLPTWILPLMILHILTPEENAYFYMPWAMAGLLLAISAAVSTSLFAEGSHMEEGLGADLRRSLKFIALILVPAVIVFVLVADKLLLVFGREYSEAGAHLLWLLSPASLPGSVNLLYLGVARVEKKLWDIIWMTGTIALGTLILSYVLLPHLGILGAGVGWLSAQTGVALAVAPRLVKRLK